ncbi:MAG TPA: hypothetical protein VEZ20_03185 [Allosphingosinicella sp.]|jgi:hypothetical protein|nr:hypothetical protein [Allosphingosinicella sp.]
MDDDDQTSRVAELGALLAEAQDRGLPFMIRTGERVIIMRPPEYRRETHWGVTDERAADLLKAL